MAYVATDSVRSAGRIERAKWVALLVARKVSAANAAKWVDLYLFHAKVLGLNPDIAIAQAIVETGWFADHLWLERWNPCGLGITGPGVLGKDYGDAENGIIAHLDHLCCYAYSAVACPVDMNVTPDPRHSFHDNMPAVSHLQEPAPGRQWATGPGYVGKILAIANALPHTLTAPTNTGGIMTVPKLLLAAGHHNSDGGNSFEIQQTGPLTQAIAAAGRLAGMDVRVLTPDGPDPDTMPGDGQFRGGIWDVAKAAVALVAQGWIPDVFIEVHTEGAGVGVRGVFSIYPDWPAAGDVDTDVKNDLGPLIARKVAAAVGGPVRGNGVMSEQATGVGRTGFRLGIFNLSAPLKTTTSRLIVEYFSHDDPKDLAIANAPGFAAKCGKATIQAVAEFLDFPLATGPVIDPGNITEPTNPTYDAATGFWIDPLLFNWYRDQGGWSKLGHPLAGSRRDPDGVLRQLFENVEIELWPDAPLPRLGGLGQKFLALTTTTQPRTASNPEHKRLAVAMLATLSDDHGDAVCGCMHESDCTDQPNCWARPVIVGPTKEN